MTTFAPRSSLEITIEDNLILIQAQGPWNIEYLDYLHQQLRWAVTQIDQSNYGVLLTPKGEAISVEAGLEYHVNFIRNSKTKAVALNLAHCTTSQLAENLFSKIYRGAGIKHAFFDNAFDARLWLEKELASTTISSS
ncbi:hypothetical protein H4J38_02450 [Colwellia sp. BRX10-3]|uniref:hypothetical protein n=1 Tax=Colwellia sp. BRX10-3 TaxID=2759844 RepID=UPI0015F5EE8F|nr:hypothetical protein [Colwellia sp. BRX10-3]MBA6389632.1 hypothetical protein [Colwellia sp. BRX10-3]